MRQTTLVAVLLALGASVSAQDVPAANAPVTASPVQRKLDKGYRLAGEKKNTEAIAAFNSVLKAEPDNHAALVSLGYLYTGVKQWRSAVRSFKAAAAQTPDDLRLRMDLAYALQAAGALEDAGAEFASVASQESEFRSRAQAAFEAIRDAAPGETKVRKLIERGYASLSRNDKAAARAQFAAAAKLDPKNTAALKQLGFLDFEAGKLQSAASLFEAAREIEPADYLTALQLGYTYAKMKKIDEARSAFTAASASADVKIHDAATAALKPAAEDADAAAQPPL